MTLPYRVGHRSVLQEGSGPAREDDRFDVVLIKDSPDPEFAPGLKTAAGLIVRSATRVDSSLLDVAPASRWPGWRSGQHRPGSSVRAWGGGHERPKWEHDLGGRADHGADAGGGPQGDRGGSLDTSGPMGALELAGRRAAREDPGSHRRGRIGWEVAQRCRAGMDVIVYDLYLAAERVDELHPKLVSLDRLVESADVITLHVPLNAETRGLIGEDTLARMKKGAFVLNVSRGGVVDEAALARALNEGRIGGAGLDVYEHEPLSPDSPLLDAPNLVLTLHLGASTKEAQIQVALEVARKVRTALAQGDLSSAVNASDVANAVGLS